jgi:cell division protein ZapA
MGQVAITINGRSYDIACDDGQEDHLARLGLYLDQKVAELVTSVGQVGDTRLMVMASLLIADELADAYDELADVKESQLEQADQIGQFGDESQDVDPQRDGAVRQSLERLAQRIEKVAARLEGA